MIRTLGLFLLDTIGLTTIKQHNVVVEQSQLYRWRVLALREYLHKLGAETPHDNIKKEIRDVLNKDTKTVHIDLHA